MCLQANFETIPTPMCNFRGVCIIMYSNNYYIIVLMMQLQIIVFYIVYYRGVAKKLVLTALNLQLPKQFLPLNLTEEKKETNNILQIIHLQS